MDYVILGSVLTYVNPGFVLGGKQRRFWATHVNRKWRYNFKKPYLFGV